MEKQYIYIYIYKFCGNIIGKKKKKTYKCKEINTREVSVGEIRAKVYNGVWIIG